MNRRITRSTWAAVAIFAVLAGACSKEGGTTVTSTSGPTAGNLQASLAGAGSTFIAPLELEWISSYKTNQPGVHINYQAVGSGAGIEQLVAQHLDYAASDAYMKDSEMAAATTARKCSVLHIPTVFGAVAIAFNEPSLTSFTLDGPALANIFLGKIKRYDDPAIKALNPGVTLPSKPIVVVHRSDKSGTTSIFTNYLSSVSPVWKQTVGADKLVKWPVGVPGQGNDGVATGIRNNQGGLGYVELAYALQTNMTTAKIKNKDGSAEAPTVDSTIAAASSVTIPADLRFNVLNIGGSGYPIVGATWILTYECGYTAAKATALKDFLRWTLNNGDATARRLNYAPVGADLRAKALANVEKINSKS